MDQIAPGTGGFAVAFGGEDGRTLFIVTAPGFDLEERARTTEGAILSTTVDVPAI